MGDLVSKAEYEQLIEKLDALTLSDSPLSGVEVARAALKKWPDDLALEMRLGVALEASGSRNEAITTLNEADEKCATGETDIQTIAKIKFHLAICLLSARELQRAAALAEEVIGLGVRGASIFALAATARYRLGQSDIAVKWGSEALKMRDEAAALITSPTARVPSKRGRSFDASKPAKNVISYSLFGDSPYYFNCAVTNAQIAMASFPDFSMRFYCGEEIPQDVIRELQKWGAAIKIVKKPTSKWEGMFWRFWAFDDPDVDVVLVRDVDSPLTPRERVAVEDWLYNSEAPFHVMRDLPTHTNPVVGGLWGGFTGFLPSLAPLTRPFLQGNSYRYADQSFLNRHVWPNIREATLAHDSNFNLPNTRPFPPWGRVTRGVHVGWAWPTKVKAGRSAF